MIMTMHEFVVRGDKFYVPFDSSRIQRCFDSLIVVARLTGAEINYQTSINAKTLMIKHNSNSYTYIDIFYDMLDNREKSVYRFIIDVNPNFFEENESDKYIGMIEELVVGKLEELIEFM